MAGAKLDLSDIQGNILRGYTKFKFARFMFFRIHSAAGGRDFLRRLFPFVTPAEWGRQPPVAALNVGLSFAGLKALALPFDCLASFPTEFKDGMRVRAAGLGDTGDSNPQHWDPPWNSDPVHLVVMVYARDDQQRDVHCRPISAIAEQDSGQIEVLQHQDCQWLTIDNDLSRKEHFGFLDGISNPDVEGVPDNGVGKDIGNPDDQGVFRKIPVGEFILGYPGEGEEVAPMPLPILLGRNGTYLVMRKLKQEVEEFRTFVADKGRLVKGCPAGVDPGEFLGAKMFGRWKDGSPLERYPQGGRADPDNTFDYSADMAGASCPLGAHIRRVNPRDSLGFGGRIMRRHRLIRRSIAYGDYLEPGAGAAEVAADRGIMFLAFNSGLDQFEFVQQTWIGQGDDFQQGNDMDPVVGSRPGRRMMIPGDESTGRPPFLCFDIPRFVRTRGGEYFFAPSRTALRLLVSNQVRVT
jgi:Dyp-type peroxidase family